MIIESPSVSLPSPSLPVLLNWLHLYRDGGIKEKHFMKFGFWGTWKRGWPFNNETVDGMALKHWLEFPVHRILFQLYILNMVHLCFNPISGFPTYSKSSPYFVLRTDSPDHPGHLGRVGKLAFPFRWVESMTTWCLVSVNTECITVVEMEKGKEKKNFKIV